MNFILMKAPTIQDMTANYSNMSWKKYDLEKYKNLEPIELSQIELKTAVAIIVSTKSIVTQREIITELMMTLTDESFNTLCDTLGPNIIEKIMPSC